MPPMIEALGRTLHRLATRLMPDPFVLAVGLTLVVLALGVLFGDALAVGSLADRFSATLLGWRSYLFDPRRPDGSVVEGYLYFAFQMCLVLVTGHALATSRPVGRALGALARLPRSGAAASATVALIACALALVHWGLGLIGGALVAREAGRQLLRRGVPAHYPLIGAAGYTGLMVWGGGLSGSIPLKAIDYRSDILADGVPLSLTLWSPLNLTVCAMLLVLVPVLAWALHPKEGCVPYAGPLDDRSDEEPASEGRSPVVVWLECSRAPALVLAVLGFGAVALDAWRGTFRLDLNSLNVIFLFAGIAAQGSLLRYVRAVSDGVAGCAGIVLQFPFYFGILGILLVTGLGAQVSRAMAAASSEATYPLLTFLSAGLVNLFVPSGGGQWIIQGDIVIGGAGQDPALIGRAVMALAYGDGWTNMLQPFWALPLLGILGLRARDIMGYTAAIMIVSGGAILLALWL
ncbi:MAG: hypothetical protein AMXMBFR64_55880 [Myxococcales bacterium]